MALDLNEWLKEIGITGDEAKELATRLAPKADAIEKGYLRQSDYSKHMNTLNGLKAEIEAKDQKLTSEIAEWASVKAQGGGNSAEAQKRIDELERQQFELQQTVKRTAAEHGLAFEDLIPADRQAAKPQDKKDAVDTSKFVDRQQFGTVSALLLSLPSELIEIAREHQSLTGKPLDTRQITAEIQKRATTGKGDIDPRRVWEELHDIPTVRQTRAKEDEDQRIKEGIDAGITRRLSELNLPGSPSTSGRGSSPILHREGATSKIDRPSPGGRYSGAVDALRSGKYREGAET